jgi:hypothetical protein
VASSGCGGGGASAPTSAAESLLSRARTAHFEVLAGLASDDTVAQIAAGLEARYAQVVADLQTGEVARIRVEVWKDEASFFAEMERYFGRRYNATGYVTGPSVLRVLAVPQVVRNATHEMSHAISLRVNPTLANQPRWLWESVAGRFPTLSELDADPNASRQVYEVGYLIGEFVVARAGRDGLLRLIRANGDVTSVGFPSPAAFEEAWKAFVRARYFDAAGLTLPEPVQ